MTSTLTVVALALVSSLAAGTAAAACYEQRPLQAIQCGSNSSNSADFSTSCASTDTVMVEVPCPPSPPEDPPTAARWVNAKTDRRSGRPLSQAATCAAYGMKPSSINGYICASGNKRPNFGTGWESIDYRHTKKGDRRVGGTYAVPLFGSSGHDNEARNRPPYYMCFPEHHGKGDRTNIVDAYVCE